VKLFDGRPPHDNAQAVEAAIAYAEAGGQALHVWLPGEWAELDRVPIAFKRNKDKWGHMFDLDRERLERTARRLGVNVIVVDRHGTRSQHVDLCGGPLERAIRQCTEE
jgi:hypothetical protein